MDFSKQELAHLMAVLGNTAANVDVIYSLYLKVEEHGNKKFGDEFADLVSKIEKELDNQQPFQYNQLSFKVDEMVK